MHMCICERVLQQFRFYFVGFVSSLRKNLPVCYIQGTLVCFIDEDNSNKRSDGALSDDGRGVSEKILRPN